MYWTYLRNMPIIKTLQWFTTGSVSCRTISRNVHHIAAFKNPRDQLGLRNLLQQSFATQFREVMEAFREVTNERPFAFMLLDLYPASRNNQRVLSHVLNDEGFMRCYQFNTLYKRQIEALYSLIVNMRTVRRRRQRKQQRSRIRKRQKGGILPLAAMASYHFCCIFRYSAC